MWGSLRLAPTIIEAHASPGTKWPQAELVGRGPTKAEPQADGPMATSRMQQDASGESTLGFQ